MVITNLPSFQPGNKPQWKATAKRNEDGKPQRVVGSYLCNLARVKERENGMLKDDTGL